MVKNGQVPHLSSDDGSHSDSSSGLKRGQALSKKIRESGQALMATLEKLAHVGEGIIDISNDPEFEAWEKEQEARREEMKRAVEELKKLSPKERLERLKAYLAEPSLLDKVRAKLQVEEQRQRNEELLRQFGQKHHTSIN